MSPLIKSCSKKALGKNIGAEIRAGKPKDQAVAIGLSTLRKSCGVESDKKLTPSEIVARKKNEAKEPFKAKLSSQLGNISAQDVDAVKEVIKSNAFMALREPLTKLGFKVSFMTDPFAVYIALKNGSSLAITNKKYVDNPDFVHGEIAMGLNEAVEKSIFTSLLSDVCGLVGVKSRALGEKKEDLVGDIMAWEGGELSDKKTLELFSRLVKNGQAWSLQGVYGRTAQSFIDAGYLDKKGNILRQPGEAAKPAKPHGSTYKDLEELKDAVEKEAFIIDDEITVGGVDYIQVEYGGSGPGIKYGKYERASRLLTYADQDTLKKELNFDLREKTVEDNESSIDWSYKGYQPRKKKVAEAKDGKTRYQLVWIENWSNTEGYPNREANLDNGATYLVNIVSEDEEMKEMECIYKFYADSDSNAKKQVSEWYNNNSLDTPGFTNNFGDMAVHESFALRNLDVNKVIYTEEDIYTKEGLEEAGRRGAHHKGGFGISDGTIEDLIKNGYEDEARALMSKDGWTEKEIKDHILALTGIAEAAKPRKDNAKVAIQYAENAVRDLFLQKYPKGMTDKEKENEFVSPALTKAHGRWGLNIAWANLVKERYIEKKGDKWVWGFNPANMTEGTEDESLEDITLELEKALIKKFPKLFEEIMGVESQNNEFIVINWPNYFDNKYVTMKDIEKVAAFAKAFLLKKKGYRSPYFYVGDNAVKLGAGSSSNLREAAESKRTVSKKPIMSWDTNQIAEDRIKDIIENPGDSEYVFDDNEEFMDVWEESGQDRKKFIALLKEKDLYDDFEKLVRENVYQDSDQYSIEWDDLNEYLTEKIKEKNPDGYWRADMSNFGWRGVSGSQYFEATDGKKLLEKILPDTDCTFYIYDFGKDGLAINNFHHDSPMGKEWYYIVPVSHAEFENEGPISQAAVVDDLMNSGDFYTGFHSKSGPVSGTREEIRAHVVKALEAEAKAQAKNIEVEEFTEGDTAEFIHVALVFPDKSKLDVSLEIALEEKDGKYSSKSADIGNTDLDEKNYVVQESVKEALGASGKPLNFPMRGSDPANIDIDSIKVEKMDLRTGEAWYVSFVENGERRASIRSWWDKAEAEKLADNMRASIKSRVKTEATAGITGNDWWKHYVNRFDAKTWAKKGKNIGVNDGAFTAFDAEWTEWEVKFQKKLDKIIAALKSGEELLPSDLAMPDTKTWGGKTTKALIELLGIKSVKDKTDLRNKLKEKLVGITEGDRPWKPDLDDVGVNAKIDPTKFDPFEKSVIEKLMVGGVPKAKAVIVFINTFGEKGDDQLSPYMLELKTMLKKKGMLTEADEYGKGLRRNTPWGLSDGEQELADGIVDVQTPGHGGIWLSPERQKQLNWSKNFLKNPTWWEEDSDWAIPYYFFRDDIKASGKAHEFEKNLAAAIGTLKRDHKEFAKRENLTEEKLVETGEADQDYEKEFYDELVKQLAAAGYKGATHREFDKYQGVVLSVPGVDKFWVKDFFTRGEIDDVDKRKPYRSSSLTSPEGEEVSSSRGDYFQLPPTYVFKGYTLVLTKQNGETVTKKNPKLSDLSDIGDVMHTFSYKRGSMSEHTIMYPEHDNKVEIEVVKDADGKVQAAGLIRYCKTHKLKREAVGESWVGND